MSIADGEFSYCPHCAAQLGRKSIHGLLRGACEACGFVAWRNPVVGVAVVVREQQKILLGRRSRGKYAGQWCIPCGYVEYHEEVREAAAREFREETGLVVEIGDVLAVHSNFHDPAKHTVGIWFEAVATGGRLQAADDLDAVAFFGAEELPESMAFPTDQMVLSRIFACHPL